MNLTSIIHETVVQANKDERANHKPGKFYPSSVGKCIRAIVYQMLGYEQKDPDGRGLMIMSNGTYFHDRLERVLTKAPNGLFVASELPLKDEKLNVSGRLDLIIKNFEPHTPNKKVVTLKNHAGETVYEGPENDVLIVELKSANDRTFSYVKSKGAAKEEHIQQLQLYMYMTGIHRGIVLYENKNTQELYEYFCDYDEEIVQDVVIKIMKSKQYKERNIIPPREYGPKSPQCGWCDYQNECWKDA